MNMNMSVQDLLLLLGTKEAELFLLRRQVEEMTIKINKLEIVHTKSNERSE